MKIYKQSLDIRADFDISEILLGYTGLIATIDTGKKVGLLLFASILTPCL